jgi:D-3-phosphoglycerate dehydrogenase
MKVLVTDEISREGLQPLLEDPRIELDMRLGLPVSELHQLIGGYEAIITRSGTRVDPALPRPRATAEDHRPGRRRHRQRRCRVCQQQGIIVVNAPFGNVNSAAEHTMAILPASAAT